MAKSKKLNIALFAAAFKEGSEGGAYYDSDNPEMQKEIACFIFDCLEEAGAIDDGDFEDFMKRVDLDEMD